MLEFKDFKIINKDPYFSSIKFRFRDDELREDIIDYMDEEINKYQIYLGYDSKGEFNIEFDKKAKIEIIVTFPSRKVPSGKKELELFINKFVMDFNEYYSKINFLKDFENDLVEST